MNLVEHGGADAAERNGGSGKQFFYFPLGINKQFNLCSVGTALCKGSFICPELGFKEYSGVAFLPQHDDWTVKEQQQPDKVIFILCPTIFRFTAVELDCLILLVFLLFRGLKKADYKGKFGNLCQL